MTFPCKICGLPQRKNGEAKKFGICNSCYVDIRKERKINHASGKYEYIETSCVTCGRPIRKLGKIPVCSNDGCRGLYYRKMALQEMIKNNDITQIISKKVLDKLANVGYTLKLEPLKKIEVLN